MSVPLSYRGKALVVVKTMVFALLLVVLNVLPTLAQAIHDQADLHFKVANATTGGPGTLDRLQIQYRTHILNSVIDVSPEGSTFTLKDVPVLNQGRYIVTSWKDGVPYFNSFRGSQLIEQENTLHIFGTTSDLQDLGVSGLTLLIKKQGSLLYLEYMIKIQNSTKPQITVLGNPTFEMRLPSGFSQVKAHYKRGPDPIDIAITDIGANVIGLTAPLTSGQNTISLTAALPFTEGMELPIFGNLPVQSWSILTFPQNLVADSFDLVLDDDNSMEGCNRYVGPALESDQNFVIHLEIESQAGPTKNLFADQKKDASGQKSDNPSKTEKQGKNKFPWIPLGFVTILAILIGFKRRQH